MKHQISKGFFKNPKFWQIVVLSVTLIALCQYFGTQTVTNTNQIPNNNNLPDSSSTTPNPNSFISQWDTSMTSVNSPTTKSIVLPLLPSAEGGQYNFTVQWGDGSSKYINSYNSSAGAHQYQSQGNYTVTITGYFKGWNFYENGLWQSAKLVGISQWGNINLGNYGGVTLKDVQIW